MRGKKWVIGILLAEGMFLLFLFAILPERTAIGGGGDTIRQSAFREQSQRQTDTPQKAAGGASKSDKGKEQEIYNKNKKCLVLVNADHELKRSYDASLRSICNGRLLASKRLYSSLVQMLSDAEEEGYHFWIASAYRSRERQQRLIDEETRLGMQKGLSHKKALRLASRTIMPAGHSEHETGLALDILCSGNMAMDISQEEERGNQWLRENSYRYGFILRYPKGKEDITGIQYEPWHFRYVGKRAATYLKKQDMTLEEFWERLK